MHNDQQLARPRRVPKLLLLILFFSPPFHYFTVAEGFRVILPILAIFVLSLLFRGRVVFWKNAQLNAFLLLVVLVFGLTLIGGEFDTFFSAFVFALCLAWPALLPRSDYVNFPFVYAVRTYLASALFVAVGVVVQVALYSIGIEFGKIDTMGGRTGFGFLWLDYSLVSIFLASAVPLVQFIKTRWLAVLYALLLLTGSFLTTARAGLAALILYIAMIISLEGLRSIVVGRIRASALKIAVALMVVTAVAFFIGSGFSDREITFDDSGRLAGYISALNFFAENFFIGSAFNVGEYKAVLNILPHNLFLYFMVMGGVMSLGVFLIWLFLLFRRPSRIPSPIFRALVISLIGFQFIPSFFSDYFFALLVSLAMAAQRIESGNPMRGREGSSGRLLAEVQP